MRKGAIALLLVAIVAVVALRGGGGGRGERAAARAAVAREASVRAQAPPPPAGSAALEPADEPRPASLAGTDVDGQLDIDAEGRFRASAAAVRMFDYFLATLGETDLAGIRALVRAEAARQLPGQEAAVLALFDRYLGYLERLQASAEHAGASTGATPRAQLERVVALQQTSFGVELAASLFGDDDAVAFATLDRADLLGRDDLPPQAVRAQLEQIEARLPPRLREARAKMRAPELVREQVEALRRRGGSAAEIWALRAAQFGASAADRLAQLDRQRGLAPGD